MRAAQEQVRRFMTEGVSAERLAQAQAEVAVSPSSPQSRIPFPPTR